jgi:hypothetical protein
VERALLVTTRRMPVITRYRLAIKIGTTDYPALPALDISGLPVDTVQCSDGSQIQVTDLGEPWSLESALM